MLRLRFPIVLVAACLAAMTALATPAPAAGERLVLVLDPQATRINFGFGATFHDVEGHLRIVEGRIELDTESPPASGQVVLDMTSATTGNGRRDRKMHEKILESDKYPRAVLHVERVSGSFRREGTSEVLLHGTLDFHGAQHMIDLPASARTEGGRVTATGKITIPYIDWGLRDPSFFLLRVAKEVEVEVEAVGHLSPAPPAP